jgi:hypothetical protein
MNNLDKRNRKKKMSYQEVVRVAINQLNVETGLTFDDLGLLVPTSQFRSRQPSKVLELMSDKEVLAQAQSKIMRELDEVCLRLQRLKPEHIQRVVLSRISILKAKFELININTKHISNLLRRL